MAFSSAHCDGCWEQPIAHRMKLRAPYKGMTHCMWSFPGAGSTMAPGCRVVAPVGDSMNQSLGFMIYYMQVEQQKPADSAACPVPMWASDQYLVFRMNYILFNSIKGVWETLPDHFECGAALKAELAILR